MGPKSSAVLCADDRPNRNGPGWQRSGKHLALLVGLACLLDLNSVYPQTLNPTGRDLTLQTPIALNSTAMGNILTQIDKQDVLSVETDALIKLLGDRLADTTIEKLQQLGSSGILPLASLASEGIDATFDLASLSLSFEVPTELLAKRTLRFRQSRQQSSNLTKPAEISGYLNFRVNGSRVETENSDEVRLQSAGGLDGALRFGGPVLAFDFDFVEQIIDDEPNRVQVNRRFTHLATDLPAIESRMTFGDIFVQPGKVFQSTDLLGFSIGRNFDITPDRFVQPTGQRQFALDRNSTVTVVQSGRRLRSFDLPAGNYNISDIPLVEGNNDIQLIIEDITGRTETIDLSTSFTNQLLARGEIDYAFSAGVQASTQDGEIIYNREEPIVALSARYGASNTVTLGHSLQSSKDLLLIDSEALYASRLGIIESAVGVSSPQSGDPGWLLASEYRATRNRRFDFGFGFEYRSEFFQSSLTENLPTNDSQDSLSAFVDFGLALPGRARFASTTSLLALEDGERRYNASASLSGQTGFGRGILWNIRASHEQTEGQTETNNITLSVSYRFTPNTQIDAFYDDADQSTELGLLHQRNAGRVGGYNLQLSTRNLPDQQQFNALSLGYTGNRYELQLDHRTTVPLSSELLRSDTTTARFNTALVFAGSSFAISRPVTESFAIVGTHPTLAGRKLRLSPGIDGEAARTDFLGKAVIPDLGAYNTRVISYDVDDLPLGYDLGAGAFFVQPPLAGGYNLQVGSAAVITVIGNLIDHTSENPLPLTSGSALSRTNPQAEPIEFFTNRTGKFALSGIAPGDYVINLNTSPVRRFTLTIPEQSSTLLRVGTIRVP